MAQHDYNLANQSGADFRADLNNALSAIATTNSGATSPSTTFAHQLWVDTANSVLKIRNSANDAWITTGVSITADNTFDINGGTVNGITSFSFSTGSTVTSILDEDNLASDSATALATQQSIKAYVDSQVGSVDTLAEILLNGNTTGGTDIEFGDNDKAIFGTGSDLQIYHDGSDSYISEVGTGQLYIQGRDAVIIEDGTTGENYIYMQRNNKVELYYDGTAKLATTSTGIDITGNATFDDNGKAIFGASSDLQIYHDGSHSYISENGTGNLILKGGGQILLKSPADENMIVATGNGAVGLYYDNVAKFQTTSTGIDVTGTVTSDGLTVDGVGSLDNNGLNLELSSSNTGIIYDAQNGYHTFKRNGTNALQINGGTGDVYFYDDTGSTQGLFWDASAESLGIGTTSPDSNTKLHIQGTDGASGSSSNVAANELFIDNNGNTGVTVGTSTTGTGYYAFADSNVALRGGIFYDHSADDMGFRVASATAMTIDSSRNVGIGTNSPSAKLHIETGSDEGIRMQRTGTNANFSAIEFRNSDDTATNSKIGWNSNELRLEATSTYRVVTNSSDALLINSSGNVGIGTTSPNYLLDVEGTGSLFRINSTSGAAALQISVPDTTSLNDINFGDSGSTTSGQIRYRHTGDSMAFSTGGTERVRINSSGNFGIGTSAPSSPLHVESSLDYLANFKSTDTTAGILLTDSNGQCRVTNTNGNLILTADKDNQVDNTAIRFMLDTTSNAGGSAKVVIREAGLGINTASPSNPLHVYHATTDTVARFESGDASVAVNFIASDNSMQISTSGTDGIIKNDGAGNFRLFNNGSERARIDSSGNVGIGTTSPDRKLTVSGTLGIGIDDYIVHNGDSNSFFGFNGLDSWKVRTGGGDRLVIGNDDSNFNTNLGIGISSLTEKFEVNGSINTSNQSSSFTTGNYRTFMDMINSTKIARIGTLKGANTPTGSQGSIYFTVNGATEAVLNQDGNFGIGITSPSNPLDVAGIIRSTSTNPQLRIYTSSGTGQGYLIFGDSADDDIGQIVYNHNTDSMRFHTNASERARIDNVGNLLIGQTTGNVYNQSSVSGFKLDGSSGNLQVARSSGTTAFFNRMSSNGIIVDFRKDGSQVGVIGASSGDVYIGTGDTGLKFNDSLNQIYAWNTSTNSVRDGFTDLGASTARFKDLYLSGGHMNGAANSFTFVSGGNASNGGANILLYGQSHSSAANTTVFRAGGSETARIDTNGNLLVGKTSANIGTVGHQLLSDSGGDYAAHTSNGTRSLLLNRLTSDGEILDFRKNGLTVGSIGAYNSATAILSGSAASYSGLYLNTNKIEPVGNNFGSEIRADNTIDIGSSTYKFKDLHLSGTGYFGTRVGIGTSSPSYLLHIDNVGGGDGIALQDTNDAGSTGLHFLNNSGTIVAEVSGLSDNTGMTFETAGSERARIDSSGNFGIGTSSPAKKLDVLGDIRSIDSSSNQHQLRPTQIISYGTDAILNAQSTGDDVRLNTQGATRLIATAEGNVGIGTTSPQKALNVFADNSAPVRFERNTSDGQVIQIYKDGSAVSSIGTNSIGIGTSTPDAPLTVHNSSDPEIRFGYSSTQDHKISWDSSKVFIDADPENANGSSAIGFRVDGNEVARFDASANLLVGTTSSVSTSSSQTGAEIRGNGILVGAVSSNASLVANRLTSDGAAVYLRRDGTTVGSISVTSSATTYNTSSDARLKDVTGEARGLEVITKLNPVAYNWKADGKADEGLIAQEVKEIVPNAVSGSEDEHYQMDYSKLVTHLVAGMKEQQEQIESLKSEIAKLKGE